MTAVTATAKALVYRSGPVQAPTERGRESDLFAAADAVRPAGHQSRTHAIFASPTLAGVTRWVRGNALVNAPDVRVRAITVNPDEVKVYSVVAWDRASTSFATDEHRRAFWDSGMTLTEWLAADNLDATEWELLLHADDVHSERMVADARVVDATDGYRANDTKNALAGRHPYRRR